MVTLDPPHTFIYSTTSPFCDSSTTEAAFFRIPRRADISHRIASLPFVVASTVDRSLSPASRLRPIHHHPVFPATHAQPHLRSATMTSWLARRKKQEILDLSSEAGLKQYVSMRRVRDSCAAPANTSRLQKRRPQEG